MKKNIVTALLLTGLVAGPANAAVFVGTLNNSPVEADVLNTNVIGAINVGSSTPGGAGSAVDVTVNGTAFVAAGVAEDASAAFNNTIGNATVGQLNVTSTGNADAFSSFDASVFTGSMGSLFDSIAIDSDGATGAFTFSLSDLQIGEDYTLQVYLASGTQTNRQGEFLQGATSILTWDNSTDVESIATFTFEADQASETLLLRFDPAGSGAGQGNGQPIIAGYALSSTAIPEPSSLTLLGLGAFGLIGVGRRRK